MIRIEYKGNKSKGGSVAGSREPNAEKPLFVDKINNTKKWKQKARKYLIGLIVFLIVIGIIFGPRIQEGLTSVEKLKRKYLEASVVEVRVGAICNDGWISRATGSGACSHHGGV